MLCWCVGAICSSIAATLTKTTLTVPLRFYFAAGSRCVRAAVPMVGTPQRRDSSRHRRTAAIVALRAIRNTSPIRPAERRAERRRLRRERVRRRDAAFYRGLLAYCGVPPRQPRRRREVQQQQLPEVEQPLVLSSDTSGDNLGNPVQQGQVEVINLDSSLETLPDIDPRPQHQIPVLRLPEDFLPPLQHQVLREAYVLLERLQLPPLQPLTPPPELEPRPVSPLPVLNIDWGELEVNLAIFDGPPVPQIQQPVAVPVPEFVPANFAQPPPMQQVDWAAIAHALFTAAEQQYRQQQGHPN